MPRSAISCWKAGTPLRPSTRCNAAFTGCSRSR
ncbi:hypothetical protein, partial [Pseudomonas aeruginosa]